MGFIWCPFVQFTTPVLKTAQTHEKWVQNMFSCSNCLDCIQCLLVLESCFWTNLHCFFLWIGNVWFWMSSSLKLKMQKEDSNQDLRKKSECSVSKNPMSGFVFFSCQASDFCPFRNCWSCSMMSHATRRSTKWVMRRGHLENPRHLNKSCLIIKWFMINGS